MLNVCKKLSLLVLLILPLHTFADTPVTSLEQLEEKMEDVRICSPGGSKSCQRFSCLESCLNLSEDPIDCSQTCYFQTNRPSVDFSRFSKR